MTSLRAGRWTSRRSRLLQAGAFASTLLALSLGTADAQTDTATMSVTANVQSACSVNGGSLNFGNYESGQTGNRDAVGTINFTNCSGSVDFELDGGQSGNINNRAMRNGGESLSYQLYRTPSRNTVFGTGSNRLQLSIISDSVNSVEVYGRIPGNQTVPAGSYTDTVNITITF